MEPPLEGESPYQWRGPMKKRKDPGLRPVEGHTGRPRILSADSYGKSRKGNQRRSLGRVLVIFFWLVLKYLYATKANLPRRAGGVKGSFSTMKPRWPLKAIPFENERLESRFGRTMRFCASFVPCPAVSLPLKP